MKYSWWKEAAFYQIYPRSFRDTNGDGIGDLKGIIEKLDYICDLGVDAIWLCPVYASPNDDNGYDISDYCAINPEYGTMEDFEQLLEQAHARGLKIIMDLVVNHTSDEHPWFKQSRLSEDNTYRDFYIWRKGKNGAEPNNWRSRFLGSAWQYDELTDMYYLHLYSKKQPDLNWENPAVHEAVFDMMRFWCEKGIDGFRMDVINMISKTPGLPDVQPQTERYMPCGCYCDNGPHIHDYLKEMNRRILTPYQLMTVGEMPNVTVEQAQQYTDETSGELNMVFQFEHVALADDEYGKWSLKKTSLQALRQSLDRWQRGMADKGWNSLYWNNHDQPRVVSRFGSDKTEAERSRSAKMLATLLYFMKGTPFIYQGEELGMTNMPAQSIDDYQDIQSRNAYRTFVVEGGMPPEEMMDRLRERSRDNARTPMQWDASNGAGFTDGTPWLKINPNHVHINALSQADDPASVLSYYRTVLRLRKEHPCVAYGRYELTLPDDPQIYAYRRWDDNETLLVLCNTSAEVSQRISLDALGMTDGRLLLSNMAAVYEDGFCLQPYEARLYVKNNSDRNI